MVRQGTGAGIGPGVEDPTGRQLRVDPFTLGSRAGHNPELGAHLSGYYHEMRVRFAWLVQRHQRECTLGPEISAPDLAQVLTALGPAFLLQRALLHDVSSDTFTRGVRGLAR